MSHLIDRRAFIQSASTLALATFPWLSSSCINRPSETGSSISPAAWRELEAHLKGPLLFPGGRRFNQISAPWNLRYANVRKPAAIARCMNADDIKICLQWVQAHKLPFVARSGGHSYAGFSTTPGLMIDLSLQNSLSYDPATGRATVGAGARNVTLYDNLPATKRSVTHGRCKEVGVGGLVLGGGIGFNMRKHGLLIDQLAETNVITASGKSLRCNATENVDLFWACRGGGGGNFGINNSFTFQTFPVGKVTVFNILWTEKLDELLPAALDLLPGMPGEFGCKLSVERKANAPLAIRLLGQFIGSPGELQRLLAPLHRVSTPESEKGIYDDYWACQGFLGEDGSPEYSHERSHYGFGTMSRAGCRAILKHMREWPGTSKQATWKMFLAGGAISKVGAKATAYWHRKASMITSIELNWDATDTQPNLDKNEAWLNQFHKDMEQYTSDESYQNFIDASQENYLRAYYRDNLGRLIKVKNDVDPGNVFHYPQSIPLSL